MRFSKAFPFRTVFPLGLVALSMLIGCGSVTDVASPTTASPLRGMVRSGQAPLAGAAIQLYAMGASGDGSTATPLLSQKVVTSAAGEFDLTGLYTCPSATSVLYVVAKGGSVGSAEAASNAAAGLMAVVGQCSDISDSGVVAVDEVSTVSSIWSLSTHAATAVKVGFATPAAFPDVATSISSLTSMSAQAMATHSVDLEDTPVAKLHSLADLLHACVSSTGGKAGDGSACGQLFSYTSVDGEAAPQDTISAAIALAKNPSQNVSELYSLSTQATAFQPSLASAPSDWTLTTSSRTHANVTGVSMALTPSVSTLTALQSTSFHASVSGSTNQAVTWKMSPALGTLSASGLYTAPATVANTQVVTVLAISAADTTKSARAFVTLTPSVSLAITPGSIPALAGQVRQFTAAVRGTTNPTVTWSISPAVGSISASGAYTAPSTIPSAQTVTVTATSTADTTKAASAQISLIPAVAIAMAAQTVPLTPSQTHAFSATVTGTTNTAVKWTLSPMFGSISSSGVYTAPAVILTPATVRVTATSAADPSKIATAMIQLSDPVGISMTPGAVTLAPSQTSQFTPVIAGSTNQAVTYSLSPAVGTISASGLYTAPSTISMQQVLTVTATSVADPQKTVHSLITLTTPVSISAGPAYTSLTVNQTRQFVSTIAGSQNKSVTWSISPAIGSISAGGLYTSPATITAAQTVMVTATSVADTTKRASTQVSLYAPVLVSISPSSLSLTPSQMQVFSAAVTGTTNSGVTWSISPAIGSISAVGLYTAPATISASQTVSVIVTSRADGTKTAVAAVQLSNPATNASTPGSVMLTPTVATLLPSRSTQFSATIAGSNNAAVTWSISPSVGSITGSGLYTAPATVTTSQTIRVTATSVANPAMTQTATVQLFGGAPTLRELGAARGVLMGAAADADEFGQTSPLRNQVYASTLSTQYGMLEAENAMKWYVIGANQGSYNFEPGDELVSFAEANAMQVRGHNLCWDQDNPAWLQNLSSAQLYQALHDHIFATMQHYQGKVFAWDVVNEAIQNGASGLGTELKDSVWYNKPGIGLSGTGYIEQAFRWARQADPSAKLFYNDHGIEVAGGKSEALLNMLRDFIQRGVPIDGVGLEMHIDPGANYPTTFAATLKSYTDLGLEVHITEMDVRIPVNASGVASASDLQAEADTYSFVVKTCLQNPHCTAIQTWGFGDKWSWIPRLFPGYGAALPFDLNYQPKPAYTAIVNTMESQ